MYKRSIVAFLVGVFVLSAGIEGRADVIFDTRIRAMTHYVGHVLAPDGADTGAFVAIAVGPSPIKGSLEIAGYVCDGTPMGQFQYYRGLVPNDGGGALLSLSAETTLLVSLPFTFTSITKRECRSTSVAMWELLLPVIRSPSQCPGTARSSTSAGRSRIDTASMIPPRGIAVASFEWRIRRRVRRCARSSFLSRPRAWMNKLR